MGHFVVYSSILSHTFKSQSARCLLRVQMSINRYDWCFNVPTNSAVAKSNATVMPLKNRTCRLITICTCTKIKVVQAFYTHFTVMDITGRLAVWQLWVIFKSLRKEFGSLRNNFGNLRKSRCQLRKTILSSIQNRVILLHVLESVSKIN